MIHTWVTYNRHHIFMQPSHNRAMRRRSYRAYLAHEWQTNPDQNQANMAYGVAESWNTTDRERKEWARTIKLLRKNMGVK